MSDTPFEILESQPRDRFTVGVSILAIVATLVAASVGLLYALSSNAADRARSRAQDRALEAVTSGTGAERNVEEALRAFELKRGKEARAALAYEQRLFASGSERRRLAREEDRWRALAATTDELYRRRVDADVSHERDVLFPFRLRVEQQRTVLIALALRDAENETASAWDKRGGTYAAILTLLTVALYLLGFALTPQAKRIRGLFAAVGASFLVLGILFGPVRALSPEPSASRRAAEAFADGSVTLLNAFTRPEYIEAKRHFDRAITARPGFATAYRHRSEAEFSVGSPQYALAPSLTAPGARRLAINNLRMAVGLGIESPAVLGSLGFELIAAGLEDERSELVREGAELTQRAIDEYAKSDPEPRTQLPGGECTRFDLRRDPEPIPLFNLAAATLASNRPDEARSQYERAICVALADGSLVDLTSGALTDLELVARHGPLSIQDDVLRLKELVIASGDAGTLREPRSKSRLRGVSIFIEAGYAELTIAGADDLSPAASDPSDSSGWLSAHWYYLDRSGFGRDGLGWSHAAQISGPVPLTRGPQGSLSAFRNYVGVAQERCLPSGRYRVELYDHGRLIGQAEAEYDQGARLRAFHDPVAGVVGCRPDEWDVRPTPLGIGYAGEGGDRGLQVARLDAVGDQWDVHAPRQARRLLARAIRAVGPDFPGLRYAGYSELLFMELTGQRHEFTYRDGEILAGVGRDADGSVIVAFVWGPPGDFRTVDGRPEHLVGSPDAVEVLTSLALTNYTAAAAP